MRIIFILSFFFFQNCGLRTDDNGSLAKVGKEALSEESVNKTLMGQTNKVDKYVGQWVAEEILFDHAVRSGFDHDNSLQESFGKFRHRYVGQLYLNHLAGQNINVSKDEVLEYYNKEIDSFKRARSGAKIFHVIVDGKEEADELARVLHGSGNKVKKDELFLKYNIEPVFVKSGTLIPELEKALFSKRSIKKLRKPIKSNYGYHVLFMLERFNVGTVVPIEDVHDEIYQRIHQQKYALKSFRILDSLRNHTPYTIK